MRDVKPSLMGKSDANECNESLLSNCRVQLTLSTKKDGMILEIPLPKGKRRDSKASYTPLLLHQQFGPNHICSCRNSHAAMGPR